MQKTVDTGRRNVKANILQRDATTNVEYITKVAMSGRRYYGLRFYTKTEDSNFTLWADPEDLLLIVGNALETLAHRPRDVGAASNQQRLMVTGSHEPCLDFESRR